MPKANFKCEKCGTVVPVKFKVGEKPTAPTCECGAKTARVFANVELGETESDEMTRVKLMMKNSQSFSGKDRVVY